MSTPQQKIDREMEKLKAMGITVSVSLAPGGSANRPMSVLKEAAERHGIHYEREGADGGNDQA